MGEILLDRFFDYYFKYLKRDCPTGQLDFDGFVKLYRDIYPDGYPYDFARYSAFISKSLKIKKFLCKKDFLDLRYEIKFT